VSVIQERAKEGKEEKYSGCTILSRKNNLLRILFISSGITQTKMKLFKYFWMTYAGCKFFTLLHMLGPELSRKSAFI